jgi:hypothetical protein
MRAFLLKNKLFTACILLFALHNCLQIWLKIPLPWADNYLDPILMMPLVLTLYAYEKPMLQKPDIGLTFNEIVAITVVVSFVAEYVFPKVNSACVGDIWDVLGYCLGSALYILKEHKCLIGHR